MLWNNNPPPPLPPLPSPPIADTTKYYKIK